MKKAKNGQLNSIEWQNHQQQSELVTFEQQTIAESICRMYGCNWEISCGNNQFYVTPSVCIYSFARYLFMLLFMYFWPFIRCFGSFLSAVRNEKFAGTLQRYNARRDEEMGEMEWNGMKWMLFTIFYKHHKLICFLFKRFSRFIPWFMICLVLVRQCSLHVWL